MQHELHRSVSLVEEGTYRPTALPDTQSGQNSLNFFPSMPTSVFLPAKLAAYEWCIKPPLDAFSIPISQLVRYQRSRLTQRLCDHAFGGR